METKPYSLQAPEEIAKEYGGNKQRIAQAIQSGLVDPTAGVLAGMFIDRMRSAQMEEQGAQQSVAQDVMTPGQGMTPGMAPPMPQGAPQMGGAMPTPTPAPTPAQPPMPQSAPQTGGGLEALPVPNDMFSGPGMAGGGLVAFAEAGSVGYGQMSQELEGIIRQMRDIRSEMQRPDIPKDIRDSLKVTFDRLNSKAAALDPQSVQSPLAPMREPSSPGEFPGRMQRNMPVTTGMEEYGITPEMMTPRTDDPATMQFLGDLGSGFKERLREAGIDPEQVRSEPETDATMDFLKKMGSRLQDGQAPIGTTNFGMTPEGNLGLRPDGSLGLVQDDRPSATSDKKAAPTAPPKETATTPDMDALQRAVGQTGTGRAASSTARPSTTPTAASTPQGEESALDRYTKMLMDSIQDKETGREEARNMALLQAGLGIMGGESPYALQNIARGALPATQQYQQQMQQMRESEREVIGDLADLELKSRELGLTEKRYNDLMKIAQMRGAGGAGGAGDSVAFEELNLREISNTLVDVNKNIESTKMYALMDPEGKDPMTAKLINEAKSIYPRLLQTRDYLIRRQNELAALNAGLGGTTATSATIPPEAISDLRADPSPMRMQQFNEVFGAGAAESVLQ